MSAEAERVRVFSLRNRHGLEAVITNYGGIVMALRVKDRDGRLDDVVLGFDSVDEYRWTHPYFGALIGRYANRIAHGRFRLDGTDYVLATNDGAHHLHGGRRGFDKTVWGVESADETCLRLTHISPDGDEGFPGTLVTRATYTLTDEAELRIDFSATTDRPTVLNLTHHSYFNLRGHDAGDILGHELFIDADRFTPTDATLIPTGEMRAVALTPFDFKTPARIGKHIHNPDPQLLAGRGYDHNYVLNRQGSTPRLAARVSEPDSGRTMEVWTTEPGLQLYTGNQLDGSIRGKGGAVYGRFAGLCLEAQAFPDSPNHSSFRSTRLDVGQIFKTTTLYKFSVALPNPPG